MEHEVSQLQTEDDDSTGSTGLPRVRINQIVEASVPKKKGRLFGLARRSPSVPSASAPPPSYVDQEVLLSQMRDKDARISALESMVASQEAGWEAQRKLNEQMMAMMRSMNPNANVATSRPCQTRTSKTQVSWSPQKWIKTSHVFAVYVFSPRVGLLFLAMPKC
ncbi:uncharacterized protein LOC130502875 [Raphanus sativus]|uniref:Uncharacterized protein LOC108845325 n=1 Tax=Raphanus sativus TaxID=3726 RepID=A0A6J0MQ74_RAPSA|nr:uncharacterized protein LOC108845325 [Raphanus sativus]XP_056853596.1 uncharacterized protein LOC130502875 [Raphanus sativus]